MGDERSDELVWHRVANAGEPGEGRVRTVHAGTAAICLTRHDGTVGALDNRCPHQGGPLGEGTIENGLLRCPWHGYDYDPITGQPPPPFTDAATPVPVREEPDGVYVGVVEPPESHRTVSDVVLDTLRAWGVTHVFGMVGHSNLGFAEAMRRAEQAGELTFVGIRHEGSAAFAASAYGKLTGRIGACFAIAGPGSTNLLTGLYDAKTGRAPVVALSGQVPSKALGHGAFQDLDLEAAFADVAQFSVTVLPNADHAELAARAAKSALVNAGVSHLVLPDEVQVQPSHDEQPMTPDGRLVRQAPRPDESAVRDAVRLLESSRRPVLIVGHGARDAEPEVQRLAEHLSAPIVTTFKAKGYVPDSHPLAGGVLGRSGTPVASWLMNEADLLVVLGASFAHHTGISPYVPTIQVDRDPMTLGRFEPVEVPIEADIAATVRALLDAGIDGEWTDQRPDVEARWSIWRTEKQRRAADDRGAGLSSAAVFAALQRQLPDDAIVPVDVGNNTYSFGRYVEMARQQVVMSGYLGSIGFALPAAMGAWAVVQDDVRAGRPARKVVSISGDGGLGQYLAEVTTLVAHGMDVTHVVLNNNQLGKISKEQRGEQYPVWHTSLVNPDFAEFARSCGALGIRVIDREGLDEAFAQAIGHDGPALVEVMIDADLV